ncbi:hypothetical protein [Stenotrophomonas sp. S39]|uniref:hypothetical protein n=1 Tax=Stenotrophomonas sp. S39 TaxID=2767451 RepID=UPI00190D7E0E|nr:hypothetical protein [Stenotrophomonas sp. S39]MBK0052929.1 hypothetical protein [Stenotrophomonas sp. S39]
MNTVGFRRTVRGVVEGQRFLITITSQVDDVFQFTATVEGVAVQVREQGLIRNKGDAMQLAMIAVERHVMELARKR